MRKNILNRLCLFLFCGTLLIAAGCGNKEKDESPRINGNQNTTTAEGIDTTNRNTDTTTLSKKVSIPDITGTWRGELDDHSSTLRITEQDSLTFKGRISTNFRQEINQEVTGKFNPDENTLTMEDVLHSRYEGTYYAKLSDNMNSMTGTFTMKVDNSKLNFNYTKE